MHVTVISPERTVFDGRADAVNAPAYDGQVGILPHHAPFLTLLGDGVLVVRAGDVRSRNRLRTSPARTTSTPSPSRVRNGAWCGSIPTCPSYAGAFTASARPSN